MTSKHLFFKAMREDLHHKTWMIALSVLANFLLLPVAWLVARNNLRMYTSLEFFDSRHHWSEIMDFLITYVAISGGVIAIVGALIVGLFGFRFVFHKKMIDTYHSIPIKRSTLYGVCWLNGFLIWLVPFLVSFLVTFAMVFSYAGRWFDSEFGQTPWILIQSAGVSVAVLTVVFFLVYHLVLTAVMISGNVLNTLVSMMIMGFGVISIYSLAIGFCSLYMSTFYGGNVQMDPAIYLSPLVSAVYLLYQSADNYHYYGMTGLTMPVFINAGMAVVLGCVAWLLYIRRASELAEQGIRNKVLSAVLKLLVSVAAGMGGWLIFMLLTNNTVGWGVFGALFAGILVFGVMDIIFSMDFKAFFSHRIQMAAVMALCLLVCFSLYGDWYGYDTYLPDKEQIAEISIVDTDYMNRRLHYFSGSQLYLLDATSIQDVDAAYRYLEEMSEREKRGYVSPNDGSVVHYVKNLATKVTLKNGRTYYRNYYVADTDLDLVWPLFSNRGYLEMYYLLDEGPVWRNEISFSREDRYDQIIEVDPETVIALRDAYNKDILENPASVLLHQGTLLAKLELASAAADTSVYEDDELPIAGVILEVYDTMENTVWALGQMGYGDWTAKKSAEEIDEVRLYIYGRLEDYKTAEHVMEDAGERYGVPVDESGLDESVYLDALAGNTLQTALTVEDAPAGSPYYVTDYEDQLFLRITDKAEIRELLELANYAEPYRSDNVFCKSYSPISIKDSEGSEYRYYIKEGELPVKYIYRFGELFEYLKQQ